jgi:hypothetical protein
LLIIEICKSPFFGRNINRSFPAIFRLNREEQGNLRRFREVRGEMQPTHAIRLHQAVSWFRCAEQYADTDDDISFITLWIALNSCYAINDQNDQHEERSEFKNFTDTLVQLDAQEKIYNCLWMNHSKFVRMLIDSQYVFPPFWKSQIDGDESWKPKFDASRKRAKHALANSEVSVLLSIVFDRLYVLRNQLIHGGATHQSQVNREQVINGKRMLIELLPVVIELMFDDKQDWGDIYYPVIENN